jgi:hypothetical protein
MKETRALSIRQPWAWFIVNGYKDVENRSWAPSKDRIGERILIHASQKRLSKVDLEDFFEIVQDLKLRRYPKSVADFEYGAIVGSALLKEIVKNSKSEWAGKGCVHWVLSKPKKLAPKKLKGMLGLFRVK